MTIEGLSGIREGREDEDDEDDEEDDEKDEDEEDDDDSAATEFGGGNEVKTKDTREAQFKEFDKILNADSISAMSKDTETLISRQGKLAESMKAMGPLLNNAKSLIDEFDVNQFEGIKDTLKNLKGKK